MKAGMKAQQGVMEARPEYIYSGLADPKFTRSACRCFRTVPLPPSGLCCIFKLPARLHETRIGVLAVVQSTLRDILSSLVAVT